MDEIDRFIENLQDAAPFEVRTTAVHGWRPAEIEPNDVLVWARDALERCLYPLVVHAQDAPFGVAVIEDRDRGRQYEQSPCETGRWFLERLATETRLATEPWLFVLVPRTHGALDERWSEWAPWRAPRPFTMTWYLEVRGRGHARRLWGDVLLSEIDACLRSVDHYDPPRILDTMLRGHPARRRFPIRRG